jgi:hypothetical protein
MSVRAARTCKRRFGVKRQSLGTYCMILAPRSSKTRAIVHVRPAGRAMFCGEHPGPARRFAVGFSVDLSTHKRAAAALVFFLWHQETPFHGATRQSTSSQPPSPPRPDDVPSAPACTAKCDRWYPWDRDWMRVRGCSDESVLAQAGPEVERTVPEAGVELCHPVPDGEQGRRANYPRRWFRVSSWPPASRRLPGRGGAESATSGPE